MGLGEIIPTMFPERSIENIRHCFATSRDFNEIFEAFQDALRQRIDDIELYRKLFWNHWLTTDELQLFGEKLAQEFPQLAYDVYMWLASIFGITHAMEDNYELALEYYRKAAGAKPMSIDPYLDASDCYEPDLNIPPLHTLINFLKQGAQFVPAPKPLYHRLAHFYDISGNDEMNMFYQRKANDQRTPPSSGQPPPDLPPIPPPSAPPPPGIPPRIPPPPRIA